MDVLQAAARPIIERLYGARDPGVRRSTARCRSTSSSSSSSDAFRSSRSTASTSGHRGPVYRQQHEKTSIAIEAIDRTGERLRYFHGPGYFELAGDDYSNVLRIGRRVLR